MNELEMIGWALVALFIFVIIASIMCLVLIKKYERRKLEFTTRTLQEFADSFGVHLENSNLKEEEHYNSIAVNYTNFHNQRTKTLEDFLIRVENDYTKHTIKVEKLNTQYGILNTEIANRTGEFDQIIPSLTDSISLLSSQDEKIKGLIKAQIEQLSEIKQLLEKTHSLHNDKITEYSSALCNDMLQLGKKMSKSKEESIIAFNSKILEVSSEAQLKINHAVDNNSLNMIAKRVSRNEELIKNQSDLIATFQSSVNTNLTELLNFTKDNKEILTEFKNQKGRIKKLF